MREHQCYDATTAEGWSDWFNYRPWNSQNRKPEPAKQPDVVHHPELQDMEQDPYDLDSEDNPYGHSDEDPDYDLEPDNAQDKAAAAAMSHAAQLRALTHKTEAAAMSHAAHLRALERLRDHGVPPEWGAEHHNASDEDDEDDAWSWFRDFENGYTVKILRKSKVMEYREMHPLDVEVFETEDSSGSFRHFTLLDFADVADILTWTKQLPDCAGGGMPLVYEEQAEEFLSNHEVHFKVKETPVQQKGSNAKDKAAEFSSLLSDFEDVLKPMKPYIDDGRVDLVTIRDAAHEAMKLMASLLREEKTIGDLQKFASHEAAIATAATAKATELRHVANKLMDQANKLELSPGSVMQSAKKKAEKLAAARKVAGDARKEDLNAKKFRKLAAAACTEVACVKRMVEDTKKHVKSDFLAQIYKPELRPGQKKMQGTKNAI